MAGKRKPFVKFQCQACKRVNYFAHKSKRTAEKKLELSKFCNWCSKHALHKEAKK